MATNPPITIGEITTVPAPGSGVKSDWCQQITQRIHHRFATPAARASAFPAPAVGQASYLTAGNESQGPEYWDGVAWRRPWNLPWGLVAVAFDIGAVTSVGGTEALIQLSPTFAATGGRRYKITAEFSGYGSVQGDLYRFAVRRGNTIAGTGVKTGPGWNQPAPNGYVHPFTVIAYDVPPANPSQQYMVGVARMTGTGAFTQVAGSTYQNAIYVEDIGPASGVPALKDDDEP